MRKRCITGILLAALLVSLCGCTSVFDKEYLSVRPYEEPSNLLTDADTTQIRNYAGLMRALNAMAAQYERSFVLAFGDYDGIIADDLAAAGIPHYTGADSFVRNGAFATCGVNYTELGARTATLAYQAMTQGMDGMEDYYRMDGGIITVNTDTAAVLKADYSVFSQMAQLVEVTTTKD